MNGCRGHRWPFCASIKIVLLSEKHLALWVGRTKEKEASVSLTEWYSASFCFAGESGWVDSPRWRSVWKTMRRWSQRTWGCLALMMWMYQVIGPNSLLLVLICDGCSCNCIVSSCLQVYVWPGGGYSVSWHQGIKAECIWGEVSLFAHWDQAREKWNCMTSCHSAGGSCLFLLGILLPITQHGPQVPHLNNPSFYLVILGSLGHPLLPQCTSTLLPTSPRWLPGLCSKCGKFFWVLLGGGLSSTVGLLCNGVLCQERVLWSD